MIENIILFGIFGIIAGVAIIIVIFRTDKNLETVVIAGGSGGIGFTISRFFTFFSVEIESELKICFISLFALFLLTIVVISIWFYFTTKGNSGKGVIKFMDIITNKHKCVETYYKYRMEELDSLLDYDEIMKQNNELEEKQKNLSILEDNIKFRENLIKKQMEDSVCIVLPQSNQLAVTNEFIEQIFIVVEALVVFIANVNSLTLEYIEKIKKSQEPPDHTFIKAYLLGICMHIMVDFFGTNSSNKIRVHFRYLNNNDEYVALVIKMGTRVNQDILTPIPANQDNMIEESYKYGRSMIKSLNYKHHYKTSNELIWEDYLTYTIENIKYKDKPFLSMGISVRDKKRYKEKLYILNFCQVENIIQQSIDRIQEQINIVDVIKQSENNKEVS